MTEQANFETTPLNYLQLDTSIKAFALLEQCHTQARLAIAELVHASYLAGAIAEHEKRELQARLMAAHTTPDACFSRPR